MKRVLQVVLAVGALLVACGPAPKPVDERQICGPQGCDACIGLGCPPGTDGGTP